jgi:hypothetical protein
MKVLIVLVAMLATASPMGRPVLGQEAASEIEAVKRVIEGLSIAINAAKLEDLVSMTDSGHAIVDGVVYMSSPSGRTSDKRQWKLEKRDGQRAAWEALRRAD